MPPTRRLVRTCAGLALAVALGACQLSSGQSAATKPATAVTPDANLTTADRTPVQNTLGNPGTLMPGGVFRIGMPRTDLKVTLDGIPLQPGFALGSYAAFVRHGSQTLAVGDLVLLEEEVAPVTTSLLRSGIEVTAVHNHLLRESPHVLYLHFLAQGDGVKLAQDLHSALAPTGTPLSLRTSPSAPAAGLDASALDRILGRQGRASGSLYQLTMPRAEPIVMDGISLPAATGVATALNFEAAGDGQAAITGDFAVLPNEVQRVLSAPRQNGIEVTALHSHMLMDAPHLLYIHFFAHGDPSALARGLREALDGTKTS